MWWARAQDGYLTSLVILLLVVLWGAVFLPAILRAKQDTSPIASVGSFRRGMRALSAGRSTPGRWVLVPKTPRDALDRNREMIYRRRRVLVALLVGSAATGVIGLLPPLHVLLAAHLGFDLVIAGYVVFLRMLKDTKRPKHAVRRREPGDDEFQEAREAMGAGSF